jgi:hypothetical protein
MKQKSDIIFQIKKWDKAINISLSEGPDQDVTLHIHQYKPCYDSPIATHSKRPVTRDSNAQK